MNAQTEYLKKLYAEYASEGGKWVRSFYLRKPYDNPDNWIAILIEGANAGSIQIANAKYIRRHFREGKNVRFEYIDYGWLSRSLIDTYLMVRIRDEKGRYTAQFQRIVQILERLNNYPLLDEDLYYKIDRERLVETVGNCLPNVSRKQRRYVLDRLTDLGIDADSQFLWTYIKEALEELGIDEYGEPQDN